MILLDSHLSIENERLYQFEKSPDFQSKEISFLDSQFHVGDSIILSTEQGKLALANGTLRQLSPFSIMLKLNKDLSCDYGQKPKPLEERTTSIYRIDKDEITSSMDLMRWSLFHLMTSPKCERLRKLVIDLVSPEYQLDFKYDSLLTSFQEVYQLNLNQQEALRRILLGKVHLGF
jgi:DNA replication ATP-dependent helicase Dna2